MLDGRAVATACVYFRRFSATHDFCEHDPRLTAPACLYLACKAEESQLQAKLLFYAMRKVAGERGSVVCLHQHIWHTCSFAGRDSLRCDVLRRQVCGDAGDGRQAAHGYGASGAGAILAWQLGEPLQ